MVNQNQIEHTRLLVQTSASLSPSERQEWLSLLPFMSDKQLLELCTVLESQPAPDVAPTTKRAATTGGRKALPEPPEELDLPAPQVRPSQPRAATAAGIPVPVKSSKAAAEQNTVSAFINRNFAQALHRAPGPVADIVPPPLPQRPVAQPPAVPVAGEPLSVPAISPAVSAVPQPIIPPVPEMVAEAAPVQPVWEEVVSRLKSLEDVRRLTVATLRAKGTEFLEEGLKSLGARYGYFSVQLALEQSPLYQTYLSVGAKVLQDHAQFESLQNELSSSGRPYLAKTEFEEMSDLLQRVKGG